MCVCTPEVKTPWCGKPGCEKPEQTDEPLVDTLFEKEKGVQFAFSIGQMVQVKGFKVKYLVQNRYPVKGHPFYDLLNFDSTQDWRNYQQVIEELLEKCDE